jgi:hypothetical protein
MYCSAFLFLFYFNLYVLMVVTPDLCASAMIESEVANDG